MKNSYRRVVGGLVVGALSTLVFAGQALAHVTIDTLGTVEQGSFAKLGISVPNERDDAGTVKLSVQMPQDHPLTFVSVQPKTGWDVETTMRNLDPPVEVFGSTVSEVVDTITWTATGDTQIGPGEFELFWISAGVMPEGVDQLAFPAVQTYSSGEEVAWIEPTPASGEEPEHPAPTVSLVAAGSDAANPEAASPDAANPEAANPEANSEADNPDAAPTVTVTDDDDSNALAMIALIVGALLGLVVGGLGLAAARSARKQATTT